jgi:hypothetical protein
MCEVVVRAAAGFDALVLLARDNPDAIVFDLMLPLLSSSTSRVDPISTFSKATPVRLPPGRFRLATNPDAIGSLAVTKTIAMVVAALRASTMNVASSISNECR